jgi:DNA-binding response OmpR family regulator
VPTVLVVDDEELIRDVVVGYLEREGFTPRQAADGDQAKRSIEEDAPDLVILDLMLPEINGLDLCRWIRETSEVPVLMLTARGEEQDRIVGLELGADDYVVKPFSPRELMQRVKAILRRSGRASVPAPTRLVTGGLVVDAETREVHRGDRLLALTATEFDLLWCLASHPRVVFSREQLMAQVWGYQAALDAGTSTVTVHVRRLREKIEDDPSQPCLITTVWGVGYRFEP